MSVKLYVGYDFILFKFQHDCLYRWGRWRDILSHARCKRRLSERDVETICRVILVFCLIHYRGDENIKSFIWELITPPENGREPQALLNHSGMTFSHYNLCFVLILLDSSSKEPQVVFHQVFSSSWSILSSHLSSISDIPV